MSCIGGPLLYFMKQLEIKEIVEFDVKVVKAVNLLLSQLVSAPMTFSDQALRDMLASPSSHLFCAFVEGEIAGMLTLGTYMSPTGVKYWVEDVVVDHACRGKALGRRLINYAIEYVKKQGKLTLMLTSKPARVAANHLYQSVGFQTKQTNVYKMDIENDTLDTFLKKEKNGGSHT